MAYFPAWVVYQVVVHINKHTEVHAMAKRVSRTPRKVMQEPEKVVRNPKRTKRGCDKAYKPLVEYFDERGYVYKIDEEDSILVGFEQDGERLSVDISPFEAFFMAHVYLPDDVPVERRLVAAETIIRANHENSASTFGMDYEDGTLKLSRFFLNPNATLDSGTAGSAFEDLLIRARAYVEAFRAVVSGVQSPAEAQAAAEARYNAE